MSDERAMKKRKEQRRIMTQEDRRVRARAACRMPPRDRSSRRHPLGAEDNTRQTTTCSRKFEMKHTTPTISESSFTLRADGWFHLENEEFIATRKPAPCKGGHWGRSGLGVASEHSTFEHQAAQRGSPTLTTTTDACWGPGSLIAPATSIQACTHTTLVTKGRASPEPAKIPPLTRMTPLGRSSPARQPRRCAASCARSTIPLPMP